MNFETVLELSKSSLRRKLDNFHSEKPEAKRAYDLLARKGTDYSIEELEYLAGFLASAHDSCVTDNPDDYCRVEVWQSVKQEERADRVYSRIQTIKHMAAGDAAARAAKEFKQEENLCASKP